MGGTWSIDSYNTVTARRGREIGVEVDKLRFKPNEKVSSTKIGLTQVLKAYMGGVHSPVSATSRRRTVTSGIGKGVELDQDAKNTNPLYAAEGSSETEKLGETATEAGYGQHGYHYVTDIVSGDTDEQDAYLYDKPQRPGRTNNAGQIFETTALAVEGSDKGTYYGSVEWGWTADARGNFTKLPLKKKSDGVPTAQFNAAAKLWNLTRTSEGKTPIQLPVPDVQLLTASTDLFASLIDYTFGNTAIAQLPKGTRVKKISSGADNVEVVDGPHTGKKGFAPDLATQDELQTNAKTVKADDTEVYDSLVDQLFDSPARYKLKAGTIVAPINEGGKNVKILSGPNINEKGYMENRDTLLEG